MYGTLMSDYIYDSVLNNVESIDKCNGVLRHYKRVCIKNKIYPAIIKDDSSFVNGILKKIPRNHLKLLDEFEGDEYQRELLEIKVSGNTINAWVYVWKKSLDELILRDWDFNNFLSSQKRWLQQESSLHSVEYDTGIRH